ncbi:unnamed protein product [Angiostrongylus costaricensis]|uniref:Clat_adaptor_s domain-containing protein n=1 Tax=Angiostrongylus costaricensis TaxID=334426 RepID=A0A0R3PY02_ANGCS|nr:unnamed protein product [Angiostrongylus costaricensis]
MGKRVVNPFMDSIGKRMSGFQPYLALQKRFVVFHYTYNHTNEETIIILPYVVSSCGKYTRLVDSTDFVLHL